MLLRHTSHPTHVPRQAQHGHKALRREPPRQYQANSIQYIATHSLIIQICLRASLQAAGLVVTASQAALVQKCWWLIGDTSVQAVLTAEHNHLAVVMHASHILLVDFCESAVSCDVLF